MNEQRMDEPQTCSFDLFLTSNLSLKVFGWSESTLSLACSTSDPEGVEILTLLQDLESWTC